MEKSKTRTILHSDLNNFYASVECVLRPELSDKPLAVCGKAEERHGIVLAKNYLAKAKGVKTGETINQAKCKCPNLLTVDPHYGEYIKYSQLVRKIYSDYSDCIEPYGMDENWIDVTGSTMILGSGEKIANDIRERIKRELGL
nr:DNA polymerase IV [Clostridia bacterium]